MMLTMYSNLVSKNTVVVGVLGTRNLEVNRVSIVTPLSPPIGLYPLSLSQIESSCLLVLSPLR